MFKKLKDKLAEEVKSSPQRIQQIAQAAQAAVTSASSSISDITNNDLFSIGDNDNQQGRLNKISTLTDKKYNPFQDVPLTVSEQSNAESMDYFTNQEETQRQRRLSNSSYASDVSFRLPNYESPTMYHVQSDMEISASEAEERPFSGNTASLDRVTKEQLYAAYRRTQERYTKYRTQYADLVRHYKLLERENAKARSVLVETQDKALRRISELREQCTLEQSAKAHLEKSLRVEIEEQSMKINALNTQIMLLHSDSEKHDEENTSEVINKNESSTQLIDLSVKPHKIDESAVEITTLYNKIEKLEQLLSKYKDSLKSAKEKNAQMTTEIQILSTEIENKNKEMEHLKLATVHLTEARQKIQEITEINEELQNKVNAYDFNKTKEMSTLELDLQKAQEEITNLQSKIDIFSKREEDYAISLAENKLSIHKELEGKEAEIKSLKDSLSASKKEIQSLNIVISDYKNSVSSLEEEKCKLNQEIIELKTSKTKVMELESQMLEATQKLQLLDQVKTKADEEYKCLQLQLNQESAEKLAMIDRNGYLEDKIVHLSDENSKKSLQISKLQNELQEIMKYNHDVESQVSQEKKIREEINMWKSKYNTLESEIQDERDELVKLQSEIEKLLVNHESIQNRNSELDSIVCELKSENVKLRQQILNSNKIKAACHKLIGKVKDLQHIISLTAEETKSLKIINSELIPPIKEKLNILLSNISQVGDIETIKFNYNELQKTYCILENDMKSIKEKYEIVTNELQLSQKRNDDLMLRIQDTESENALIREKLENINKQYDDNLNQLQLFKNEKQCTNLKIEELENKCHELIDTINHEQNCNSILNNKLEELEKRNENLMRKVEIIENEKELLSKDSNILKDELSNSLHDIEILKKNNEELKNEVIISKNKESYTQNLEENDKDLKRENLSLNSQLEDATKNLNSLLLEIDDLRKSHAEIEEDRDRLNSVLNQLESEQYVNRSDSVHKISPRDSNLQSKEDENHSYCVYSDNVKQKTQNNNVELFNEISDKLSASKSENELLREETRRLKSDIEGLQTYLTKMSKENSVLNDNLRELIASSENYPDRNDMVSEDLKNEVQSTKEKVDDLTRENNLLAEENLELKDQLQSQNSVALNETKVINVSEKEHELTTLKEKYNKISEMKNNLQKQLADLETTNNTVSENMLQIQEKNEKLKLSNEKLARRLDEALVSLRHLHSLQENTELEYLRNILYEYLTGSGTHSVTLAKVLSAVVKFDDKQTQLVLQKEKERQGLLRQLGLI